LRRTALYRDAMQNPEGCLCVVGDTGFFVTWRFDVGCPVALAHHGVVSTELVRAVAVARGWCGAQVAWHGIV